MTFGTVKLGAHILGALGVTKIVGDVIANNTVVNTTFDLIRVRAGSLVIGTLVAEHAANHVETQMDRLHAWYTNQKNDDPPA